MLSGYPVDPPPLPLPPVFEQSWRDLTFLHWPVHPHTIAHMYPPGTRPDVFGDGSTYVGLLPFVASGSKLGAALPLPYFGTFPEYNVRLYSIDDAGRHGLLFRALETTRLAVVPVTRIGLGVPYSWAEMRVTRSVDTITYHSVRRWPRRGLRSRLSITVGETVEPTPLEIWLSARWGAHTRKAGRTWWVPISHEPWKLHAAKVHELNDDLLQANGMRPAGDRMRALFSPGVRTRFGRPAIVG